MIPFGVRMAVATVVALAYLVVWYPVATVVLAMWAGVTAMRDEAEERWRDWLDGWRQLARCRTWTDKYDR